MQLSKLIAAAGVAGRNAILGGNLMSLRLLGQPRRMANYVTETLFLYRAFTGERRLIERNVFEVLPSAERATVVLGDLHPVKGGEPWMHELSSYTTDIISLCLLCAVLKPKKVFEIGTLHGYTAYHFALNTPDDSTVFSLDLPKERHVRPALRTTLMDDAHAGATYADYCFSGKPEQKKISLLFGDSAAFDYSPYIDDIDLFFIDGAHSYEYVRSDTLNAMKCCRPGGVIAWHDFGRVGLNGVSRWLHELSRTETIYSVPGGSLAFFVRPDR